MDSHVKRRRKNPGCKRNRKNVFRFSQFTKPGFQKIATSERKSFDIKSGVNLMKPYKGLISDLNKKFQKVNILNYLPELWGRSREAYFPIGLYSIDLKIVIFPCERDFYFFEVIRLVIFVEPFNSSQKARIHTYRNSKS